MNPTNGPAPAHAAMDFESFSIESKGTRETTVVKVNGKEVKNLAQASIHFWNDDYDNNVSFQFSVADKEVKPGTLNELTYYRLIPPSSEAKASVRAVAAAEAPNLAPRNMRAIFASMFGGAR